MSKKIVTIIDVKNYVGQEVTIGAWVANKSGKGKIEIDYLSNADLTRILELLDIHLD